MKVRCISNLSPSNYIYTELKIGDIYSAELVSNSISHNCDYIIRQGEEVLGFYHISLFMDIKKERSKKIIDILANNSLYLEKYNYDN